MLSIYLNPSQYHDVCIEMLYETLVSILDTYKNHRIIIFGDFNAHIGCLNQAEENTFQFLNILEMRHPLHKIENYRDKKLVQTMEYLGLYSLNGRVKGDIPGKLTYF